MLIIDKIRQEIKKRISEQHLSILAVEKKAQISSSTLKNLLSGQSKTTGIKTLSSIADALGCSISELCGEHGKIYTNEEIIYNNLYAQIGMEVLKTIDAYQGNIKLQDVTKIINQVLEHTLKQKNKKIDLEYINWLIDHTNNI